jgi:hypothetical protein
MRPSGSHCEQDRPDRRADEDSETCTVRRSALAGPSRTSPARRGSSAIAAGSLGASSGRRQGGERDNQRHRTSACDRHSDGSYEQHAQGRHRPAIRCAADSGRRHAFGPQLLKFLGPTLSGTSLLADRGFSITQTRVRLIDTAPAGLCHRSRLTAASCLGCHEPRKPPEPTACAAKNPSHSLGNGDGSGRMQAYPAVANISSRITAGQSTPVTGTLRCACCQIEPHRRWLVT